MEQHFGQFSSFSNSHNWTAWYILFNFVNLYISSLSSNWYANDVEAPPSTILAGHFITGLELKTMILWHATKMITY